MSSFDCEYQCEATSGSNPFNLAKASKNLRLLLTSLQDAVEKRERIKLISDENRITSRDIHMNDERVNLISGNS